ncbi:MAG: DNA alkylation repair protein [Microbacterium sp.]|uniref:DNA alkylation repair enzyme n=1 Tax=Microbacterium ginsengisoli TaxID=400772 RepID=A0A0F0LWF5_9MICO|nr:DNA alkylation repair protein [Microbacterium ginsengisoli]KJL35711.1 DNA alkylation repair enzyme [Microbacterium ginsengisoli]MAL05433.1 DNA alkylation repair protein [Microbacterium sp.]MBN9208960.1 DNA alkylation repair protein [Microbacterium ginsengisoli]HAN22944.1 DNA alkylation repair protein [Microbacterium ginsengisoli]
MTASAQIVEGVRADLRARADPARAAAQQAYMTSAMPFRGVPVPEVRRLTRQRAKGVADAGTLRAAAEALWSGAEVREERYAALAILALRPLQDDPSLLGTIERCVREGQWWDLVDELAHRVADQLEVRPRETARLVRAWAGNDDMWLRRIAIISQLGRGTALDETLLDDAIRPNIADTEFFVRKAIGWALRDHARVAPDWVRAYVEAHPLSPLSRREALRNL